jgi:hypothetical protein
MQTDERPRGRRVADTSPLDAVPAPEAIRDRMTQNAEENRVLRSLFRLARRIESRKAKQAENRQGVADAK